MRRECPFCGNAGSNIQLSVLRLVCLDCGASGPVTELDPEVAWNQRADDFLEYEIAAAYEDRGESAVMIRMGGVSVSVRTALDMIFDRKKNESPNQR